MNSKEIVQRTLNFQYPPRVAHSFYPSDFVWTGIHVTAAQNQWKRVNELDWRRVDEWGNEWRKTCYCSKGKIIKNGLQGLDDIESYQFPDFCNPVLYTNTKSAFQNSPQHWHIGVLTGSTFEIANALLKNYLSLMLTDMGTVDSFHDRIDAILKIQIRQLKEAGADGVMIIEDLGDSFEVPLGPSLWKDQFRPRIQSLCDYAHSLQLKIIMHSFQEIALIPELIYCGVDCIQIDSPGSIGLNVLQTLRNKNHVSFWCPLDIHTTLQSHNEASIRSAAREMLQMLWHGEGGFIAGYFYDNLSLGLDPKWQEFANDEFLKFGKTENFKA
ncbi:MAG TPA: uroporphyrinogen decarboxylase family protein [Chitinispirillaceae bacterium]|nr:uroporphyrinogen decarboxylase family protein [Chitinispirillaceae bacterium]